MKHWLKSTRNQVREQMSGFLWGLPIEAFLIVLLKQGASKLVSVLIPLVVVSLVVYFLFYIGHPENIPVTLISLLAAYLAFLAKKHTEEKFRLDLYEKRYEIYLSTLKFCSMVQKYADLPSYQEGNTDTNEAVISALIEADKGFRGEGYHKTRFLFGEDIWKAFDELNESFGTLRVNGNNSVEWMERKNGATRHIYALSERLPDLFKPYMYFGNYKVE